MQIDFRLWFVVTIGHVTIIHHFQLNNKQHVMDRAIKTWWIRSSFELQFLNQWHIKMMDRRAFSHFG